MKSTEGCCTATSTILHIHATRNYYYYYLLYYFSGSIAFIVLLIAAVVITTTGEATTTTGTFTVIYIYIYLYNTLCIHIAMSGVIMLKGRLFFKVRFFTRAQVEI